MGCSPDPAFLLFFRIDFGIVCGPVFQGFWTPKRTPKLVENQSQNQFFFWSALGAFFLSFRAPSRHFFAAFWASWGRLGGLKNEKMLTVLCENHFFEKCLFRFWGPSLALFGSSRRPWASLAAQMAPKIASNATPKFVQKVDQNWTRF